MTSLIWLAGPWRAALRSGDPNHDSILQVASVDIPMLRRDQVQTSGREFLPGYVSFAGVLCIGPSLYATAVKRYTKLPCRTLLVLPRAGCSME